MQDERKNKELEREKEIVDSIMKKLADMEMDARMITRWYRIYTTTIGIACVVMIIIILIEVLS